MSSQVRWKLNNRAIAQLRVLPQVIAECERVGESMLAEANDTLPEGVGYRMASHTGTGRQGPWASVNVYTSSNHAKNSNAVHDTLTRIVNGR